MEENMNREELVEQLEEAAIEESLDVTSLPAEPELEGGFDLKSFGIGAAVFGGAALLIKYGPRAGRWVKNHLPKSKKQEVVDDIDDYEDAEDADYVEVDADSDEEPAKK